MSVWAITMMRNEADVAHQVVAHMLDEGVDGLVVADNLSTDGTREILDAFTDPRVHVLDDPEPGYHHGEKINDLTHYVADHGATWILPFDADEWWYSTTGPIGEILTSDLEVEVLKTWGYDHRVTSSDGDDPDPFRRMEWRDPQPQRLPKIAFRYHPDAHVHVGNHDVDVPGRRDSGLLAFRHFGYRSFEQMRRKVRQGKTAVEVANIDPMYCTHWRELGALTDDELLIRWKAMTDLPDLVHDPCPT